MSFLNRYRRRLELACSYLYITSYGKDTTPSYNDIYYYNRLYFSYAPHYIQWYYVLLLWGVKIVFDHPALPTHPHPSTISSTAGVPSPSFAAADVRECNCDIFPLAPTSSMYRRPRTTAAVDASRPMV